MSANTALAMNIPTCIVFVKRTSIELSLWIIELPPEGLIHSQTWAGVKHFPTVTSVILQYINSVNTLETYCSFKEHGAYI